MKYLPFHEALEDCSRLAGKVPQALCLDEGDFPVIGQGRHPVEGFTNDSGLIFRGDLPVILFGDHTATFKFIDRPFARGADGTKLFRPRTQYLDAKFAWHFLQTAKLPDTGYDRKTKYLESLKIPLPPLEEQRRIAAILDKVSEVKALNNSLVLKLRGLIQSLFSRARESSTGVDVDYEAISLGNLLANPLRNGVSPSSQGTYECRVLTLSAITRGVYQPEASKNGLFAQEPAEDKKVCSDDFLICRGNGNLKLVGLGEFPTEDDSRTVFPDTMIAARLREDLVDKMYFSVAWKQESTRRQIESLARTTNGTAKVNQAALESVEIVLPPLQIQWDFSLLYGRAKKMLEFCEAAKDDLDVLQFSLQNDFFKSKD